MRSRHAQRRLSTPARLVRRRAVSVDGRIVLGSPPHDLPVTARTLLAPLEEALRAMSWGVVLLAAALAVARGSA